MGYGENKIHRYSDPETNIRRKKLRMLIRVENNALKLRVLMFKVGVSICCRIDESFNWGTEGGSITNFQ